jgi:hypothetical protein
MMQEEQGFVPALVSQQVSGPVSARQAQPLLGQRLNIHESEATRGLAPLLTQPEFKLAQRYQQLEQQLVEAYMVQASLQIVRDALSQAPVEAYTTLERWLRQRQHQQQVRVTLLEHRQQALEAELKQEWLSRWPVNARVGVSLLLSGVTQAAREWDQLQKTVTPFFKGVLQGEWLTQLLQHKPSVEVWQGVSFKQRLVIQACFNEASALTLSSTEREWLQAQQRCFTPTAKKLASTEEGSPFQPKPPFEAFNSQSSVGAVEFHKLPKSERLKAVQSLDVLKP